MRVFLVISVFFAAAFADSSPNTPFSSIDWYRYWTLDETYNYMNILSNTFPDIAEVVVFGGTIEGRQIRALRIVNEEILAERQLPAIFVTAGASARDWISVMAALELMHQLVEQYADFRDLVDRVEWFIIPIANPDGFEFSRTEGNRDWVKNRNPIDQYCTGVNVERNFLFNWGLNLDSSANPCHDLYRGPSADSEEETKTIQFAMDVFQQFQQGYISIKAGAIGAHSLVTYPFSSNNELFRPHFKDQISVANEMTNAIWRNTGGRYRVASESMGAGLASGTSGDYATGQDGIPYSYTIYAPRGGENGWDVPASEINRIVREIFVGVTQLASFISNLPEAETSSA